MDHIITKSNDREVKILLHILYNSSLFIFVITLFANVNKSKANENYIERKLDIKEITIDQTKLVHGWNQYKLSNQFLD